MVAEASAAYVLEACSLYRFYHAGDDETVALSDVSLAMRPGEFVVIMGPSGSGKSTLLACITGLEEPDAGMVLVGGRRITRRPESERSRMRAHAFGILLQSGNLFPHLTVRQNISLQLGLAGKNGQASQVIERALRDVELVDRIDAYPAQLSGGEAARAGLAVAVAKDPPIIVADEPTAEVDRDTESRILEMMELRRKAGRSALMATHSERLATRADRIVRLWDGRILDA